MELQKSKFEHARLNILKGKDLKYETIDKNRKAYALKVMENIKEKKA